VLTLAKKQQLLAFLMLLLLFMALLTLFSCLMMLNHHCLPKHCQQTIVKSFFNLSDIFYWLPIFTVSLVFLLVTGFLPNLKKHQFWLSLFRPPRLVAN
jgi:hypothetical protein